MSVSAREHFHVMSKPTGAVCNLDCEYCFFLSKEQLYPDSEFRMAPEVHETYLEQLFAAHPADAEVSVSYQGGEPTLMGLEFFARSVQLAARFAGPNQSVLHTIQTNGTLLDDEWGAFLAELAVAACAAGYSIYFTSLDDLVRKLKIAEATGRFNRQLNAYLRPALLVVDEVGYLKLDRDEANMFFQLISRRYERGSVIITSNKSFPEWGAVLGDDILATAILDRLLHHCRVVNIKGHSYRLREHAFSTQNLESQRAKELVNSTT